MKDRTVWVGVFVLAATALLAAMLFLLGDQHKAFRRHADYYAEFTDLSGIMKGTKVRVSGMDAGEVAEIRIPSSPQEKFRVKVTVDDSLRGLIRSDSVASVETAGIVGDEYMLIKSGSTHSPEAAPDSTLPSKEPFDLGKMLDHADGLMAQVGGTLTHLNGVVSDVQGKLDGTLGSVTATVNNTNGIVTDIRRGKGAAGALLEDATVATDVKTTISNTRQATAKLNAASAEVNSLLSDVERRQLVAKVDDTLLSAQNAAQQLNQVSQQVNDTLKVAFAPDQYGQDAGTNLQQSLANVNAATGNLADDTEALKHEFFFKGFFKKRGYDNLEVVSVTEYRSGGAFRKMQQDRHWLTAQQLFTGNPDGTESLTATGRKAVDEAVGQMVDLYSSPLIIEGYNDAAPSDQQMLQSRRRAMTVRTYLQLHWGVEPKNTGIVGLGAQPPDSAGKKTWNGICIVRMTK